MNPHRLSAKGIGINEVAEAVGAGNVDIPAGSLDGPHQSYALEPQGQLKKATDYDPLVVAYSKGYPVRIRDVGKGADSCLLYTSDAADDLLCVDLVGRRIIKKKKIHNKYV
mgnify:CR=1 FL=1